MPSVTSSPVSHFFSQQGTEGREERKERGEKDRERGREEGRGREGEGWMDDGQVDG